MIRFQIIGETPAKKNKNKFNTKTKNVYKDKKYQAWHLDAMIQVTSQIARMPRDEWPYGPGRPDGINVPVSITLTFYHGDQVRRDSDNQTASIMDLLQDAKVLADDRWQIVRILNIYNHFDKGNARCLVEINEL